MRLRMAQQSVRPAARAVRGMGAGAGPVRAPEGSVSPAPEPERLQVHCQGAAGRVAAGHEVCRRDCHRVRIQRGASPVRAAARVAGTRATHPEHTESAHRRSPCACLHATQTSPTPASAARPRAAATLGGRAGTAWRWARAKPWRGGGVVTKMLRRITSTIMIRMYGPCRALEATRGRPGEALMALRWIHPMGGCSPAGRPLGGSLGRAPPQSRSSRVQTASCSRFTGNLGTGL